MTYVVGDWIDRGQLLGLQFLRLDEGTLVLLLLGTPVVLLRSHLGAEAVEIDVCVWLIAAFKTVAHYHS